MLSVDVDSVAGVPVLRLRGRIAYGENLQAIHDIVTRLHSEGHERLVVDLTHVDSADSTGISALLQVKRTVGNGAGRIMLLRPSERVRRALAMIRVTSEFEIVEDETDLLQRVGHRGTAPAGDLPRE